MSLVKRVMTIILLFQAVIFCFCSSAEIAPLSLENIEPQAVGKCLLHLPENGYKVQVNPPGFTWTAHPQAASYNFLLLKSGNTSETVCEQKGLTSTVQSLRSPLKPGEYEWYVVYCDSAGSSLGRSEIRNFIVKDGLEILPLPDPAKIAQKIQGTHPRLFLFPEEIGRIKTAIKENRLPFWDVCLGLAEAALKEPLYPEPASYKDGQPYVDGEFAVDEWVRIYTPAKRGTAHMTRLALAYMLTGDSRYFVAAKKWLIHFAGWDAYGITSYNLPLADGSFGNDEASMPLLWRMSMVYDWLADKLTADEKTVVLDCLKDRAGQMLEFYQDRDFLSNPWSNHAGRALAYFGLASLACLGELPEAEEWFEYTLRSYLTSYPSYGGRQGGWDQGLNYWESYILKHTYFLDALRKATSVDLYKKPFFRNNGFFPLYFHPPYAKTSAFGDTWSGLPSLHEKLLLKKYGQATGNTAFLWHATNIKLDENKIYSLKNPEGQYNWREWEIEDVTAVLSAGSETSDIEPLPPSGLPGSRWFQDIGWVAMHSDLGNAKNDVYAYFRSSRFGSQGQSHADQNSFHLNAFGEPLLIDTGYYPWYRSPHHTLWTSQTKAHNALLINGRGQGNFLMEASGEIEYFEQDGSLTIVQGEASRAYNVPLHANIIDIWKKHLSEPVPSVEPKALTARRTLVFNGSKDQPWMVVHDYVETAEPASLEFLLHTVNEMQLEENLNKISASKGNVNLLVYLISDGGLSFSQTSQFSLPPEGRYREYPAQWHFSAKTKEENNKTRFLALMVPYRAGTKPPSVDNIADKQMKGFKIGDEQVLAWWGDTEIGSLNGYGIGRLFIDIKENKEIKRFVAE